MKITSKRGVFALACAAFFALGLLTAALGPLLSELAQRSHSTLSGVGGIFSAIFLGALLSQLVSGAVSDRWGEAPLLLVSGLVLSLGLAGLTFSRSLPLTLALALVAGLGHGAADLGTNVLVARLFARRSVSALNMLNLFFGAGAFAGPALVSAALGVWGSGVPVVWGGAAWMTLAVVALFAAAPRHAEQPCGVEQPAAGALPAGMLRSRLLWGMGLLLLVYVGAENAFGGWTTTYLQQTSAMPLARASLVTAGFWLALTAGRMVVALLGTRLRPPAVLALCLGVSFGGAALLVLAYGSAALSVAAVLLTGFGFGGIFPTTLAVVTAAFPQARGRVSSVVVALGSLGGMFIPWLQGVVLERLGTYAAALFLLALGGLMLLAPGAGMRSPRSAPLPQTSAQD